MACIIPKNLFYIVVDKYVQKGPDWGPGKRYLMQKSGEHRIALIDHNLETLRREYTTIQTKHAKEVKTYRDMLMAEKKEWDRLNVTGRKLRGDDPQFKTVFLNRCKNSKRTQRMHQERRDYLASIMEKQERLSSNIRAAISNSSLRMQEVNVEGFFEIMNDMEDEDTPLLEDDIGPEQRTFELRSSNKMNQGGSAEVDENFRDEIISILCGTAPVPETNAGDHYASRVPELPTQSSISSSKDISQSAKDDEEGWLTHF